MTVKVESVQELLRGEGVEQGDLLRQLRYERQIPLSLSSSSCIA